MIESSIDEANDSFLLTVSSMRLQNHGAENGRQCQRHNTRDDDAHCHGQSELAIEHADRPCHERNGNKTGDHHQCK